MITKESSEGFMAYYSYPVYEYQAKTANRFQANCDGSRMIPPPDGYTEVIRYADIDTHFTDYLRQIKDEYEHTKDGDFIDNPYGIFIGNKRNARWRDEAKRRGLTS